MNFKQDFIDHLTNYGRLPVGSLKLQYELMKEFKDVKDKLFDMKKKVQELEFEREIQTMRAS